MKRLAPSELNWTLIATKQDTDSRVVTNSKSIFRSIYGNWDSVLIPHGIAPTKVRPSKYIDLSAFPLYKQYWRDIPSKKEMELRFQAFVDHRDVSVNYDVLQQAFETTCYYWQKHYGTENFLVSLTESISLLPSSTSAGLPYKSGVKKGDVRRHMLSLASAQWRRIQQGKTIQVCPCRAGARRQLRERGKNKPRLVWAYPGYISVIENQFLAALQKKEPPSFIGWSINWMDQGRSFERVARNSWKRWGSVAQLDFSAFDSTIPSFLINYAFEVVSSLFVLTREERIMLNNLKYYFIHTPINMYGRVFQKHRGIPSGSTFTQLIGSICNMIMCIYCDKVGWYSLQLQHENSCWLGDDSLLFFDEGLAKEEFEDRFLRYFKHFGVDVNSEKSNYLVWNSWTMDGHPFIESHQIKFLGRNLSPTQLDYKLSFSKFDAQVAWPEHEDRSKHDTGMRLIGLVWAYGMYYDTYLRLLIAYKRLDLRNGIVDLTKVTGFTNRDTSRFIEMFVGMSVDVTSFPSFEEVSDRYFDNVRISRSYRTKNADYTCPRPT